jgi:hypothetical protein
MIPGRQPMRLWSWLLVLAAALSCGRQATAKDLTAFPHNALGFSANVPKQFLGFSLCTLRPHKVGLYVDIKAGIPFVEGSDSYYDNISIWQAEDWGDHLVSKQSHWISLNVGGTFVISSAVACYFGGGYSHRADYREYYDEFHILGEDGHYMIDDGSASRANFLGGLLVQADRTWGLQFGAESAPRGVTLGVFWLVLLQ